MTIHEDTEAKRKRKRKSCQMYGHWSSHHKKDRSTSSNFPSSPTSIVLSANSKNNTSKYRFPVATNVNNILQIENASLILRDMWHNSVGIYHSVSTTLFTNKRNRHITFTANKSSLRPFVDDGDTYSATGKVELGLLLNLNLKHILSDQLLDEIANYKYCRYWSGRISSQRRKVQHSWTIKIPTDHASPVSSNNWPEIGQPSKQPQPEGGDRIKVYCPIDDK